MSRLLARPIVVSVLLAIGFFALLVPAASPETDWFGQVYASRPALLASLRKQDAAGRALGAVEDAWRRQEVRERAGAVRAPATPGVTFQIDAALSAAQRRDIETLAQEEIAEDSRGAPRHRVAVVAEIDPSLRSARYERSVVLPLDSAAPCTIVLRLPAVRGVHPVRTPTDRLLGTCGFYAAFGAPGAGMQQWLLETNLLRAGYLRPPAAVAGDTARIEQPRGYFDRVSEFEACRAGRLAGCATVFTPTALVGTRMQRFAFQAPVRELAPTPELRSYSSTILSAETAPITSGLLGALADSLGASRFATIWRSALPPDQAYARETGRPIAAWVRGHLASRTTPYQAGPGIPAMQALFGLAVAVIAALVAIWRSPRVMS
jgi:hypothetical protein